MLGNRFFLNTGIWTQNVLCKGEMNFNKRYFYIAINQNIRRVFEVTTDMANAMCYDCLLAWIAIIDCFNCCTALREIRQHMSILFRFRLNRVHLISFTTYCKSAFESCKFSHWPSYPEFVAQI